MRFVLWGAVLSSALIGSVLTATSPQAAGLDGLHEKIRVGNRLCMSGHTHDGSGHGASRDRALADAAHGWGSFTALEYGHEWSDFRAAHNQNVSCDASGGEWRCSINASPCRPAGPVVAASSRRHVVHVRPVQRVARPSRAQAGLRNSRASQASAF